MATAPELKLYNTLAREKSTFVPIDADNVRMYVCGPTVYDFAHIGNARPVIVFDVLYRLLRHLYGENHITYVRNITDVDDKINARALRDHPGMDLNAAIRLVTEKTERQFHDDVAALGCLKPSREPRATEHIAGMVAIIQKLIDSGHAYIAQGQEGREALFDVLSMSDYGALSKRNLSEQQAGARIAVESHKRNPADFVLWKESVSDEPGWNAVFEISDGNRDELRLNSNTVSIFGRPGWHIECSAMSQAFLGETFDIHGGGLDLIFPHHENEIAQSRCAHGTHVMANVWMHNGFVQVEGRKMSKSEGNFVTIHDLLATEKFGGRKWPGEVLRLAMLMTHYREPIDFSVKRLEEAYGNLRRWNWIADQTDGEVEGVYPGLIEALCDDLSSAEMMKCLHFLSKYGGFSGKVNERVMDETLRFLGLRLPLIDWDRIHGLDKDMIDTVSVELYIEGRLEFLKSKNFAEADRIRDELLAKGIQLKDGKDPLTGERVTTWEVKR